MYEHIANVVVQYLFVAGRADDPGGGAGRSSYYSQKLALHSNFHPGGLPWLKACENMNKHLLRIMPQDVATEVVFVRLLSNSSV